MSKPLVVKTDTVPAPGSKIKVKLNSIKSEDRLVLAVAGVGATIIVLAGGKVASTALLLSVMTLGGAIILWIKMPNDLGSVPGLERVLKLLPMGEEKRNEILTCDWKKVAEKHQVAIDVIASLSVFLLYGGTIVGMIAAGLTGLGVSIVFKIKAMVDSHAVA